MKCLMCRENLQYAMDYDDKHKPSRADAIMDGGTVEVSFGYGSSLDCQMALGFICDECFDNNCDLFVNHYNGLRPSVKEYEVPQEKRDDQSGRNR